ncbi:MAG TPA: flagellar motor protein MotB [Thermotogaceae bacterium]|nr:flagellar motor protein MotB [Thermotogaceae bacterium]
MAKKKREEKKGGSPAWMTTYGDMVTLLLTFFVAMISMSTISPGKFQQVAAGIQRILSGKPPSVLMGGKSITETPLITANKGIREEILKIVEDEKYKGKITIKSVDEGTLITLKDMAFFEPASAKLTAEAKELLSKIGTIVIEHTTNVLEIYGYCDDKPLPLNSIYPSNWHLGAARAASVAKFFVEELKEKRIRERFADVQLGRFVPDYFYDPDRFVPIAVGDKAIKKEIKRVESQINTEIELLDTKLSKGEISQSYRDAEVKRLKDEFEKKLEELRREYRRIDILIKREKAR